MPQYQVAPVHGGRADWNSANTVETTPLTTRQLQILDYLHEHLADHGHAPTQRQIAAGVGLTSASSVHHQLERLQALGHVHRAAGRVRALSPARSCVPAARARLSVIDGERS